MLANLWNATSAGDDLTGLNNYKFGDTRTYRYFNFSNRVDWNISSALEDVRPRQLLPDRPGRERLHERDRPAEDAPDGRLAARRLQHRRRHGLHAVLDQPAHVPRVVLQDHRPPRLPRDDIGESGYAQLWPSGWYTPTSRAGRSCTSRTSRFRAATRSACGTSGTSSRSATASARSTPSAGQPLAEGRIRHALQARGRLALQQRGQLHVQLQQDREHRVGRQHEDRPSLGELPARRAWTRAATTSQFVPMQYTNTEMYAVYVQDDFRVTQEPDAQPRPALRVRGRLLGSREPAPAAARPDRPDPRDAGRDRPDTLGPPAPGNTGKTIAQIMSESAGQRAAIYNGAFYFTEEGNKRATTSYTLQLMPRVGAGLSRGRPHVRARRLRPLLHAELGHRQRQRAARLATTWRRSARSRRPSRR